VICSILLTDIKSNRARDAVRASAAYLDYIGADSEPAGRLVASGIPAWVVHAEKGDGGLTDAERATLDAAPLVTVVTIPGAVFFLPDEARRRIAEVTAGALERASRSSARDHRGRAETARSRRESGPWMAGLDLLGR
jgi:hypothetical protein